MFGIGLALLIVLVEAEWHVFAAYMPLLDSWLGRGVLQASWPAWACWLEPLRC